MFTFGQPLGSISFGPQAQATPMNPTIMALIENYMAMGMSRMEAELKARQQIAQMAVANSPAYQVAAQTQPPAQEAPKAEPPAKSKPEDAEQPDRLNDNNMQMFNLASKMLYGNAEAEEQQRQREQARLEAAHPGILAGGYQTRGQQGGLLNYTPARPIGLFG